MLYLITTPVASLIFLLTLATSLYAFYIDQSIIGKFILHPAAVAKKRKLYTLFTSGLIHKDWMHLLFNMFTYYFFAFQLEQMIGSLRFGIIYVLALVLSNIPTVIRHKNDYWYHSLGASGAISGILFSFILLNPMSRMMIFPLPIPLPAILFGVLYLAYCYYMGKRGQDGINHDAHFFGAIAGIVLSIILIPNALAQFVLSVFG